MADHFVSLTGNENANDLSDIYNLTQGTSSTAGDDIELRVHDGAGLTRKDVLQALCKFAQFFENLQVSSTFDLNP